jgi:hypothetical protein
MRDVLHGTARLLESLKQSDQGCAPRRVPWPVHTADLIDQFPFKVCNIMHDMHPMQRNIDMQVGYTAR